MNKDEPNQPEKRTPTRQEQEDFESFLIHAWNMSRDVDEEVEEILRLGRENPLPEDEARRLNLAVLRQVKAGAKRRGDTKTLEQLPKTEEEEIAWVEDLLRKKREARQ